jgi:hypothetical protein
VSVGEVGLGEGGIGCPRGLGRVVVMRLAVVVAMVVAVVVLLTMPVQILRMAVIMVVVFGAQMNVSARPARMLVHHERYAWGQRGGEEEQQQSDERVATTAQGYACGPSPMPRHEARLPQGPRRVTCGAPAPDPRGR